MLNADGTAPGQVRAPLGMVCSTTRLAPAPAVTAAGLTSVFLDDGTGQRGRWLAGCILTPGQSADGTQAGTLIEGVPLEVVIANRAYDSKAPVETIKTRGGEAVIPTQKSRKEQRAIDREC